MLANHADEATRGMEGMLVGAAGNAIHRQALLPACLRREPGGELGTVLESMDPDGWGRLVDEAAWHGVAPLLHHRLQGLEGVQVPPEPRSRLRDLYHHLLLRNRAILRQLEEVLHEAAAAGCSLLALKGSYLAYCVYENAALRPMADIDLLGRAREVERVQELLLASGYRHVRLHQDFDPRTHHLHPLSRRGSVPVELHRDLAPGDAPFRRDLDAIWRRSTTTRVQGFDLPHPALDDVLLHACVHATYNDEMKMGLLAACDVDAVVCGEGGQLDWGRFVSTANGDGVGRFAYVALAVTRTLLHTWIPPEVLRALDHDREDEGLVELATEYALDTAEVLPVAFTEAREAPRLADKARAIWRGVFPEPKALALMYGLEPGSRLLPFYYLLRPFDLVRRRGREVLSLIVGSRESSPSLEKDRRRRAIRKWARGERRNGE